MFQLAQAYSLSDKTGPAVLRETPLFSWSTPERNAIGGELFLWTQKGRPLATIGIWTYDDIKDSRELQSLSADPLKATSMTKLWWQPSVGGLVFKKLDGDMISDSSPVRRQAQMRNLLREMFSAEMTKTDNQQIEKLRLLPQPLYKYDPLPANTLDGAMFAYAFGTDPEVFVLLEARNEKTEVFWYYAFAPSTSASVRGYLSAKEVWNSDDQLSKGTFRFILSRFCIGPIQPATVKTGRYFFGPRASVLK